MAKREPSLRQSVSVLVADGNRLGSQLLGNALRQCRHRFRVVGTVVTMAQAIESIQKFEPRVALVGLDLQDGSKSGLDLLRQLRPLGLKTRAVLLLDTLDFSVVVDAFRGGAKGVFCREEPTSALCKCVSSVHKGQIWASSRELEWLLRELASLAPLRILDSGGKPLLTPREESIVNLVANGLSNRDVSKELKLSEHTVKNYMFRIFDKLGVSSRSELVVYAFNHRSPV